MIQPKSHSAPIKRIIDQLDASKTYQLFEIRRLEQQIGEMLKSDAIAGYMLFGMLSACLRDYEGTVDNFKKSLALAPTDIVILFNYALSLERLSKNNEAFDVFRKLINIDVGSYDVLDSFAVKTILTGRFSEFFSALDTFKRAVPSADFQKAPAVNRVCQIRDLMQSVDLSEDDMQITFKHVENVLSSRKVLVTGATNKPAEYKGFRYLKIDIRANVTGKESAAIYEEILEQRLQDNNFDAIEKFVVDIFPSAL